uniref:Putative secreted protein n=1 Tax=Anopheles marajoara TaxID=58244 RepID=A0A2M4CB50_9DIPT
MSLRAWNEWRRNLCVLILWLEAIFTLVLRKLGQVSVVDRSIDAQSAMPDQDRAAALEGTIYPSARRSRLHLQRFPPRILERRVRR